MRNIIAVLVLLLSSAVGCRAEPPTDESINTLLTITKTEAVLESVYGSMEQAMRQGMTLAAAGKPLSAEQQRFFEAAPKRFAGVMREELSWESIRPIYIELYKDNFTQEEIDGLIAFYRSPVGVAFINKMPVVMQKSTVTMQSRLRPMMGKMQAAMKEALEEAKIAK